MAQLARLARTSEHRLKQLLRLSYLAPEVIADILSGNTPAAISRTGLRTLTGIPLLWEAQRHVFALG